MATERKRTQWQNNKCNMKGWLIFTVILLLSLPLSYILGLKYWAGLMDQVQLCPWVGSDRGGTKSCGQECYSRLLRLSFELKHIANRVQDMMYHEGAIVDSELVGMSERARDVAESAMMELHGEKKSETMCDEVFSGPEKGWDGECGGADKVSDMVSVLINLVDSPDDWWERLKNLTSKLQDLHPGISVLAAIPSDKSENKDIKATIRVFPEGSNPGTVWNDLIGRVSTPYVVLARDVIDFGSKLDRLLRATSSIPGIAVAAVSVRIGDEWEPGCVQRRLAGYVLEYEPGYWHSRYECLFCHYTDSPFLSNTTLLRELFPLDESLTSTVIFHDLFIRLEEFNVGMVSCPDVMFDIRTRKEPLREDWLPLANKFQIEKIKTPKTKLQFNCAEARLTCKRLLSLTANFLVPECCKIQFSSAMAFWHKMSNSHNIHYKINTGVVVGAVKMANFLPFDHDGDMNTVSSNHSTIMGLKSEFVDAGFGLWEYEKVVIQDYKIDGGCLFLWTPDIKVEAYGVPDLWSPRIPPEIEGHVPSLMRIRDAWLSAPPNPGLFIRNRYGGEVLRHSQGWNVMGKPGSYSDYEPGKFLKCSQPDHQACLDHFPADGSIPYMTD